MRKRHGVILTSSCFLFHSHSKQTTDCEIGDSGGEAIGEALKINESLTKLNIGGF